MKQGAFEGKNMNTPGMVTSKMISTVIRMEESRWNAVAAVTTISSLGRGEPTGMSECLRSEKEVKIMNRD